MRPTNFDRYCQSLKIKPNAFHLFHKHQPIPIVWFWFDCKRFPVAWPWHLYKNTNKLKIDIDRCASRGNNAFVCAFIDFWIGSNSYSYVVECRFYKPAAIGMSSCDLPLDDALITLIFQQWVKPTNIPPKKITYLWYQCYSNGWKTWQQKFDFDVHYSKISHWVLQYECTPLMAKVTREKRNSSTTSNNNNKKGTKAGASKNV